MEATTSEYLDSISFSSDNKYVVANGLCWEVVTGNEIPKNTSSEILSNLFIPNKYNIVSRDGKYKFIYDENKVFVKEIDSERTITEMTYKNQVESLVISSDEKHIIVMVENKVHVWMWRPEDLISTTSKFIPRNLTRAEWEQYIGDALPYQAVCENLPIEPEPSATPD
jgi:hypothetical protein